MELDRRTNLMLFYSVQSIFLGIILIIVSKRHKGFDKYQFLFAITWTVAVVSIRFRYGMSQTDFYSSDQGTQLELINQLKENGLRLSIDSVINGRYLVVIPARLLNLFGIDELLALKFMQAICLSIIYKLCSKSLLEASIKPKLWHTIFFAGPLFIFISTIGLRDIQIVLCTTYFFFGRSANGKIISLFFATLLRPHLAVALVFGWLIGLYLKKFSPKRIYLFLFLVVIFAFPAGGYGFALGGLLKYKVNYSSPTIFEQASWWRLFSNIVGLQFLTFGENVVKFSVTQLLSLRLFFIDSFLVPILFIATMLKQSLPLSNLRIQVFASFVFFLGLVAQTNFNSTRQNLPFLSTMGVLALLGLLRRSTQDSTNSRAEVATLN